MHKKERTRTALLACAILVGSSTPSAALGNGTGEETESGKPACPARHDAQIEHGKMKLTVLVDNNTLIDRYFLGEPGISLYIEQGGKRILLDVGYSDLFLTNAQKMNIDLRSLDYVVLSHGHLDHTWGLDPLIRLYTESRIENIPHKRPAIVAHPLVFLSKTGRDGYEIGSIISEEKLSRHFTLSLSKEPQWLTDRMLFLGQIERKNDFESTKPIGSIIGPDGEEPDYLFDDTALVYKASEGLVIITGCSHSGICNIIEQAKSLCKEERVLDIIGGLHLLNPSEEQMQGTLEYLERIGPERMHACHCTALRSKIELAKVVPLEEVGVGMVMEYE